jgi:hypothetical protein
VLAIAVWKHQLVHPVRRFKDRDTRLTWLVPAAANVSLALTISSRMITSSSCPDWAALSLTSSAWCAREDAPDVRYGGKVVRDMCVSVLMRRDMQVTGEHMTDCRVEAVDFATETRASLN